MGLWLARRAVQAIITFVIALTLLFVLMRLAPGDPVQRLEGERPMSPQEIARLRQRFGVDQPIGRQYRLFLGGVARGDLGTSIEYNRPVTALLRERLPATILLGGTVILVNFTLGMWLGVRQAQRRGSPEDRLLTAVSLAGHAMPSFWLALILAWLVGVRLRWLPSAGLSDPLLGAAAPIAVRALDVAAHLVLPALTLILVTLAGTMRFQRGAMLEVLRLPYIVTARAKGVTEVLVTWRHAWRNAVFPMVTLLGLWLPLLVTGSVFVEAVFAWPGLGSLAAAAAGNRDYPLLMGVAILSGGLLVGSSLLADLAYAALDPRVRLS
ncbi:MAG: ABC transporter permease [Gemmatimonadales bacterium]